MDDSFKNEGMHDADQTPSYSKGVAMKKCPNCKANIEADSLYCEYCGSKIVSYRPTSVNVSPGVSMGDKPKAPMGTGSLFCSIVGMVLLFFAWLLVAMEEEDLFIIVLLIVGLAMSIVGMVLGSAGKKRIMGHMRDYSDSPKLIVGMVLGIVGVVSWGLMFWLVTLGLAMDEYL